MYIGGVVVVLGCCWVKSRCEENNEKCLGGVQCC